MLGYGAHDEWFCLANTRVFLAGVSEVFPCSVARTDDPAGLHGDAFVDYELAEQCAAPGFPIVVVPVCLGDQLAHLAVAGWRCVANRMCHLVRQPERNYFRLESERTGVGIGLTGEVLQGDERHAAAVNDEFASVGRSDANHENDIRIDVGFEDAAALALGESSKGDHIDACEHRAEVIAVGVRGGANYFLEVRSLGVQDVVCPVRLENSAVRFEVAQVSSDAISAVYDSKEIWKQVDQHQRQENTPFANAQQESTANCLNICTRIETDFPGHLMQPLAGKAAPWHRISLTAAQEAIKDSMTALRKIELRCPSCSHEFRSQTVVSTNWFGGKRTDFHERAAGAQPWAYQVHMCDRCGYSGAERDFTEQTDISPLVRERVWNELSPLVHSEATGSEKYEAAAKVAEWQGADQRYIGDLWLRAAWCCVDEGDAEAERYFRRLAAWSLEQALEFYDTVERDDRAVLVYLVGELWRRIGDLTQANAWFDLVPDEVTDAVAQQWIVDAAYRQRTDPKEWFA